MVETVSLCTLFFSTFFTSESSYWYTMNSSLNFSRILGVLDIIIPVSYRMCKIYVGFIGGIV